jgi:hypothetical protein
MITKLDNSVQEAVNKPLNVSKDRVAGQMSRPTNPDVELTYILDFLLLPSAKFTGMVIAVKDSSASLAAYICLELTIPAGEFTVQNRGSADDVLLYLRIVDVARGTTAAQTYFKERIINEQKHLDGRFCTNANNPSQIAWKEVC